MRLIGNIVINGNKGKVLVSDTIQEVGEFKSSLMIEFEKKVGFKDIQGDNISFMSECSSENDKDLFSIEYDKAYIDCDYIIENVCKIFISIPSPLDIGMIREKSYSLIDNILYYDNDEIRIDNFIDLAIKGDTLPFKLSF